MYMYMRILQLHTCLEVEPDYGRGGARSGANFRHLKAQELRFTYSSLDLHCRIIPFYVLNKALLRLNIIVTA